MRPPLHTAHEAKRGMENALRAKPLEIKERYERQVKELQEAYGEVRQFVTN